MKTIAQLEQEVRHKREVVIILVRELQGAERHVTVAQLAVANTLEDLRVVETELESATSRILGQKNQQKGAGGVQLR